MQKLRFREIQTLSHSYLAAAAAAAAKSLSCVRLCSTPIDSSPPGSPVPGIPGKNTGVGCHFLLQRMKVKSKSEVAHPMTVIPWPAAYQAPLFTGLSRQEYWSGLPLSSLGYLASRNQSHDVNQISLFLELKNLTLCLEGKQFPSTTPKSYTYIIVTLGKNNWNSPKKSHFSKRKIDPQSFGGGGMWWRRDDSWGPEASY